MTESDDLLLERLAQGHDTAFEDLFLRHYGQVYRVLYSVVGSREAAEDLLQETFLALYQQPPRPKPDATLVAWLCRVALNRAYNALRGERRERQRIERMVLPVAQGDPHTEVSRAEERAHIRTVLKRLPERQGKLLLLRHAGLSYAEIAAVLEVAPGSIGTLLVRAERAFLTAYEQLGLAEREEGLDLEVL